MGVRFEDLPEHVKAMISPGTQMQIDHEEMLQQEMQEATRPRRSMLEKELHKNVHRELTRRKIWFVDSRMDKPTTQRKGVPDFTCCVHGRRSRDRTQAPRRRADARADPRVRRNQSFRRSGYSCHLPRRRPRRYSGDRGRASEMSETAAARSVLAPFCVGMGLDIGFGGTAITPGAICFDMPQMYCPSLEGHRQHLRGDARHLPFICDGAFDYIYCFSSPGRLQLRAADRDHLGMAADPAWSAGCWWSTVQTSNGSSRTVRRPGNRSMPITTSRILASQRFKDRVLVLSGGWQVVFQNPDVAALFSGIWSSSKI